MTSRAGSEFVARTIRALRLDAAVYLKAASPGGGSWQAFFVVLLAALGTGLGESSRVLLSKLGIPYLWQRFGILWNVFADEAIPISVIVAIAHVAAWPVWAVVIWTIGKRLASERDRAPPLWSVARALAFAQAPGVFLVAMPIFVHLFIPIVGLVTDPEDVAHHWVVLGQSVPRALDFGIRTLVSAWVLLGTFLAIREVFGFSHGRALGAIFATGFTTAMLFGVFATAMAKIVVSEPSWAFGLNSVHVGSFELGVPLVAISIEQAVPVIHGFDFNLGLIDAFMRVFIYTWP